MQSFRRINMARAPLVILEHLVVGWSLDHVAWEITTAEAGVEGSRITPRDLFLFFSSSSFLPLPFFFWRHASCGS